ncbi:MAG: PHP-associated domain-containing protein [Verrucomicrobiota bacterium]
MGLADLHMHTTASDGMMSPAMLLNYVSACTPLDTVAITDHNTLEGWEMAIEFQQSEVNDQLMEIDIIKGLEVSSSDGHVIGLFIDELIPRDLSAEETVIAIHEQSGLALAPHPYAWLPGLPEFKGVGDLFLSLPFDAVETRNSTPTELLNNHLTTRRNKQRHSSLPEYGGSDAHFLWAVARTHTVYPGKGIQDLRSALVNGTTRSQGTPWGPISLAEYFSDKWKWQRYCKNNNVQLHDL